MFEYFPISIYKYEFLILAKSFSLINKETTKIQNLYEKKAIYQHKNQLHGLRLPKFCLYWLGTFLLCLSWLRNFQLGSIYTSAVQQKSGFTIKLRMEFHTLL